MGRIHPQGKSPGVTSASILVRFPFRQSDPTSGIGNRGRRAGGVSPLFLSPCFYPPVSISLFLSPCFYLPVSISLFLSPCFSGFYRCVSMAGFCRLEFLSPISCFRGHYLRFPVYCLHTQPPQGRFGFGSLVSLGFTGNRVPSGNRSTIETGGLRPPLARSTMGRLRWRHIRLR